MFSSRNTSKGTLATTSTTLARTSAELPYRHLDPGFSNKGSDAKCSILSANPPVGCSDVDLKKAYNQDQFQMKRSKDDVLLEVLLLVPC